MVIMVCLNASLSGTAPIDCREVSVALYDAGAVTPFGCVMKGQEQLAQMRVRLDGRTAIRWRCEAEA